jgi:transposase-like protein
MRRRYTGEQRSELIEQVSTGGTTVAAAAARLGVAPSTAYLWLRKAVRATRGRRSRRPVPEAQALAVPRFVRVVPSGATETEISVRVGAAEIQVRRGFDAELLRGVVEALREGAA